MKSYSQSKEEVLADLNSNPQTGLVTAEAERRLTVNGKNKLQEGKKKSVVLD